MVCLAEKLCACILEQLYDVLKTAVAAVVRVGHMVGRVVCEVVGHTDYFALSLKCGSHPIEPRHVVFIHRNHDIEVCEVVLSHGSRTMRYVVSVPPCVPLHAFVGWFARVKPYKSRRIDEVIVVCTLLFNDMLEDSFGHRTAAYVAQAYEKYLCHSSLSLCVARSVGWYASLFHM